MTIRAPSSVLVPTSKGTAVEIEAVRRDRHPVGILVKPA